MLTRLEPARPQTLRRQAIRPLTPDDTAAVAGVLEQVFRSGRAAPSDELVDYVRRLCLDSPGYDPGIPPLVYEDAQGRIAGFLRVFVRRMIFDGRPIRMACSGPFATLPEVRSKGAGVFLLRQFLSGPQDLSITDGANDEARYLWEQLGGQVAHLHCLGWRRLLRPAEHAGDYIAQKRPALKPVVTACRPLSALFDSAARRLVKKGVLRPPPVHEELEEEDLVPKAMAAAWPRLSAQWRLRPDYDESYLIWLLDEMSRVTSRGSLVGRQVHDPSGKMLGWYLYYLSPCRIAAVMQIAAAENKKDQLLMCLLADADRRGATAVQGRLEAGLTDSLYRHRCRTYYRAPTLALIHSRQSDAAYAIHAGQAFLTRADGEWWTGFFERL
ncbi:hypothetical protein [Methylocaldum sp.]|uniref:hypothetical protein n=1 Tax=Methylocaldum sp. TaxID=1969727 RepID=UPI002D44F513|nr:hypothetical protein [Methylocaldum sp.]HYE35749.1 hypothetical protein [Methylocaldum sp.]